MGKIVISGKFVGVDTKCKSCKHLITLDNGELCSAYPSIDNSIPQKFLTGFDKDHTKVEDGQFGEFVYTPK